jgi:Domain of unknown function (DUF1851)
MRRRDIVVGLAASAASGVVAMSAGNAQSKEPRAFMIEASYYNAERLLEAWRWLVSKTETPLLLSAMGDWVFGRPDGTMAKLDILEGRYVTIAKSSNEFNALKRSEQWLDEKFSASWVVIARGNGLVPTPDQCLGWKIAPIIGGKFAVSNLALFDMAVYQSIQGQMHRQIQGRKKAQ